MLSIKSLIGWRTAFLTFALTATLMLLTSTGFSQDCCNDAQCRARTASFVTRAKVLLAALGPCPTEPENQKATWEQFVKTNPDFRDKLTAFTKDFIDNGKKDQTWGACFASLFNAVNMYGTEIDMLQWLTFLRELTETAGFNSPEFHKGLGVHFDVNQGVADVGKSTEAFSFATRALLSYTVGHNGMQSGGKWRFMLGPSYYRIHDNSFLLANPRVEFRVKDIANDLTSIGNIKLIADGNFGEQTIWGGGVGAEIYRFGIQVLYQRQDQDVKSHLFVGIFLRIQKEK